MTKNHSLLTNYKSHAGGLVTIGDVAQTKIRSVGTIMIDGVLLLIAVFIVDLR